MSVYKNTSDKLSPKTGSQTARVPQVDNLHLGEMRKLERDPNHISKLSKGAANRPGK